MYRAQGRTQQIRKVTKLFLPDFHHFSSGGKLEDHIFWNGSCFLLPTQLSNILHVLPAIDQNVATQTKAGSGNDILRKFSCGEGREAEIPGGADQEAPPERKGLIGFPLTRIISFEFQIWGEI